MYAFAVRVECDVHWREPVSIDKFVEKNDVRSFRLGTQITTTHVNAVTLASPKLLACQNEFVIAQRTIFAM